MRVFNAKIIAQDGKRYLAIDAPISQISTWLENNHAKLPCEVDIKIHRNKRSVNANAYMWQLADKIASEIGITKEEVYRSHIREVGRFDDIAVRKDAVESFVNGWHHNGVGWFAETVEKRKTVDVVRVYYGSSTYDTKEMSRLIDSVVHEAKGLSIETMTPDEIERMVKQWSITA